ncbi:MAG TPA: efflux RND transporter periplasmic adaptor subunit [Burkholderiales bacterium]|nr:efflux RND transporter periplasmic adaptor subunit [Burkholderiales bacterium]
MKNAVPEEDLAKLKISRGYAPASSIATKDKIRRALLTAVAVSIAAGIALFYFSTAPIAVEPAQVTSAYPSQQFALLNATGYVVAQRKAAVASKATGRLEWLGVAEGSRVKKDEIIARLENRDMVANMENAAAAVRVAKANLQQGEAEYRDAERAFNRARELLTQKFVSQSSVDTAQARFDKAAAGLSGFKAAISAAEAQHRSAQVAVEYTLIRAPFDGVILSKTANVGDVVTPFSSALDAKGAVVTMADMSTLEVEADVSESNLQKVQVDQPTEIQLDALPDLRFRGVVSRIVPTVDRSKATVITKVRFVDPDPRILPEMSAKVSFLSQELNPEQQKPRTVVNLQALATREDKTVAFVIRDGRVKQVAVETGGRIGDLLEVKQGLQFGDKVVLNPSDKLADGAAVKLVPK